MAQTIQEIQDDLKLAYPTLTVNINGVDSVLDQSAYDARIATMAYAVLAQQQSAEAEATKKSLRDQVRLALDTLTTDITTLTGTPTNAQVVASLVRTDRILKNLIQVLVDRQIVEAS